MRLVIELPDYYRREEFLAVLHMARKHLKATTNPGNAANSTKLTRLIKRVLEQVHEQ